MSKETDCLQPLLNNMPILDKILIHPVEDCNINDRNKKDMLAFETVRCVPTIPHDEDEFVQFKKLSNMVFVYCPYNTILLGGSKKLCPMNVFALPLNTNFSINNIHYAGKTVKLRKSEIWAPLTTTV